MPAPDTQELDGLVSAEPQELDASVHPVSPPDISLQISIDSSLEPPRNSARKPYSRSPHQRSTVAEREDSVMRIEHVVQHIDDECEDPFDPALWTRVSNQSTLTFNYYQDTITGDLGEFPMPLYDKLGYGELRVEIDKFLAN